MKPSDNNIFQPANGLFFAFDYRFDENADKITLTFNSNFPSEGTLKILNPWYSRGNNEEGTNELQVVLDGEEIEFHREKINRDELLTIQTDFLQHVVEIIRKKSL